MQSRRAWIIGMVVGFSCAVGSMAQDAAPATTGTAAPPIGFFTKPQEFTEVVISPNGKYFAALVPIPDDPYENVLAIFDGATAKVLHAVRSGHHSLIARYFWASDDRLVATLAIKSPGQDTPHFTGELFAVNSDGTHATDLFGYRAAKANLFGNGAHGEYARAAPIGNGLAVDNGILIAVNAFTNQRVGYNTRAERLDVRTGHTIDISEAPAPESRLFADHAGQVRVAVASDNYTTYKMWVRADNHAPWTLLNDPSQSHVGIGPIGFNRDNSKLYVEVSHGSGPDSIELMDLASGSRTLLYRGQFANPGQLLPTADGLDYYGVFALDGRQSLVFFDENAPEARLTKALAVNFPGQLAWFSSFTQDGRHAIVTVQGDRNPGDYLLFDLDTHNARYLMSAARWIDPAHMRPMEPMALTARDGLVLHGFLTTPSGNQPYPLVVLPHGGPYEIHDYWHFDPEVQLLASRGYAVLQVNFRGSGGYGGQFQMRGYRQWGLSMQDDLTDATRWAIQQGIAKPNRICIYGGSYGGYAALEGATRESDLYQCAIGYAGVYDLRVQLDRSDTQQTDMGENFLRLSLGTDRDDLLRRSPLSGAERIKADVLLIHGKEDPRVPYKNFQEFTAALDKYGKHYDTLVEPDEGHGFFVPAHREEMYEKMLGFLDRNIGAGYSP